MYHTCNMCCNYNYYALQYRANYLRLEIEDVECGLREEVFLILK